ncbi:hypothetical protein ACLESO_01660 [Pyxidicoccus sp. 3LG]
MRCQSRSACNLLLAAQRDVATLRANGAPPHRVGSSVQAAFAPRRKLMVAGAALFVIGLALSLLGALS